MRCFCLPPDPVMVQSLPVEQETMSVMSAGTDERRFRRLPNPTGVDPRDEAINFEGTGTEVRGFWVPPDG